MPVTSCGKVDHLAGHDFIEAVNARDAVADRDYRADFFDGDRLLVVLDLFADDFCDFVRFDAGHSCSCRDSEKNSRSNSETFGFELRAQTIELLADRAIINCRADLH